jgi:hypothetical protein
MTDARPPKEGTDLERVVTFRVPAGWRRRAANGELGFQSPDGTGLLRVKVLTFTSADELTPQAALAELASMDAAPGQTLELLANGNALRAHREVTTGDADVLHIWLLAGVDAPRHRMHLAVFSYASTGAPPADLMATFDAQIRGARFTGTPRPGV